jgi:hypothetical protein
MRRGGPAHDSTPTPVPVEKSLPKQEALSEGGTNMQKQRLKVDLPSPSQDVALKFALELKLTDLETELTGLESFPLAEQDPRCINVVKGLIAKIRRRLGR